jgi:hypothetical protein
LHVFVCLFVFFFFSELSAYELTVWYDVHFTTFDCAACGGNCTECGLALSGTAHYMQGTEEPLSTQIGDVYNAGSLPKVDETDKTHTLVRLVQRQPSGSALQTGSMFFNTRVAVGNGFESQFTFRLHDRELCLATKEFLRSKRTTDIRRTNFPLTENGRDPPCPQGEESNRTMCERVRSITYPGGIVDFQSPGNMTHNISLTNPACPNVTTDVYDAACAYDTNFATDNGDFAPGSVSQLNVFYDSIDYYTSVCESSDGEIGKVGGEGFAFIIHNDARALNASGCSGTGIGFAAAPGCTERIERSVAIEFDSFFNVQKVKLNWFVHSLNASTIVEYDYDALIAAFLNGFNNHSFDAIDRVFARSLPSNYYFNDGNIHAATVAFLPYSNEDSRGMIEVTLDGLTVLQFEVDMANVVDESQKSLIGFVASSGVSSENMDIISWKFCNRPKCDSAHVASVSSAHSTRNRNHV